MGREIKRVSLDFNWPLKKTWGGYLNPNYRQSTDCPACAGSGYSTEAKRLSDLWYGYLPFQPEDRGSVPFEPDNPSVRRLAERNVKRSPRFYGDGEHAIATEARRLCVHFNKAWLYHINQDDVDALISEGRLMDFTHTWSKEDGWEPKDPPNIPTPKEVNEWNIGGMGHDSINQWIVTKAECKRVGIDPTCAGCNGEGTIWASPESKQLCEEWTEVEPPVGEGYQMWETTSEGSPISPVFETPEELARWLVDNNASAFGSETATYEEWLRVCQGGYAPSAVLDEKGLRSGVAL